MKSTKGEAPSGEGASVTNPSAWWRGITSNAELVRKGSIIGTCAVIRLSQVELFNPRRKTN